MLAAGTQVRAEFCLIENKPADRREDEDQVSHGVNVQHVAAEGTRREHALEELGQLAGRIHAGRVGRVVEHRFADEDRKACAQEVDGGSGDGLVRMELNTDDRVNRGHQCAGKTAAQEGKPAVSGKEAHDCAGECTDCHHAFNTDVDDTRALREAGTQRRKQQGRRGNQSRIDQKSQIGDKAIHLFALLSVFLRGKAEEQSLEDG